MTPKRKTKKADPEDYPHDRITVSVLKGYKHWMQQAALELNRDMSKIARQALEDWYKANRHLLSDDLNRDWEEIRKHYKHDTHWSDFL